MCCWFQVLMPMSSLRHRRYCSVADRISPPVDKHNEDSFSRNQQQQIHRSIVGEQNGESSNTRKSVIGEIQCTHMRAKQRSRHLILNLNNRIKQRTMMKTTIERTNGGRSRATESKRSRGAFDAALLSSSADVASLLDNGAFEDANNACASA